MSDTIRIFSHSISMIFGDFGATLRATSAGLMVIALALILFIFVFPDALGTMFAPQDSPIEEMDPSSAGALVIGLILMFIGMIMMLTAWHRYVLLPDTDRGRGFTPGLGIVLGYLGRSMLLGFVILILGLPVIFLTGVAISATGSQNTAELLALPVNAVLGWIVLRLSLILPACAIGQNLSLRDSWAVTQPLAGTIFGLAAVLAVLSLGITQILNVVLSPNLVGGLINMAVSLLYALVSASMLTTLYGIVIEKRQI